MYYYWIVPLISHRGGCMEKRIVVLKKGVVGKEVLAMACCKAGASAAKI
jgi:hypothetical protein